MKSYEPPRIVPEEFTKATIPYFMALSYERQHNFSEALIWYEKGGKNYGAKGFKSYFTFTHEMMNWTTWRENVPTFHRALSAFPELDPHFASFLPVLPELGLKAARAYADNFPPQRLDRYHSIPLRENKRIRIGYTSSDFTHPHAMIYLMYGLFTQHDRSRFEVFLYSLKEWNDRTSFWIPFDLHQQVEHWRDVGNMSDREIAETINKDGIDILLDLNGWMSDNRIAIYSYKPAPIQVNYMACPTNIGAPYFDYILSDLVAIPPQYQKYHTEKVLYVADSYFISNHKRMIVGDPLKPNSDDFVEIPDDAGHGFFSYDPWEFWTRYDNREELVFCNFGKNLKLDPYSFDIWMEILKLFPKSVLRLGDFETKPGAVGRSNLVFAAEERGVDPGRLEFHPSVSPFRLSERLKRCHVYLDSFIYGAHTLAVDSLWAGTPIVVLEGKIWSQQVGASILTSLGLYDVLVAKNESDYVQKVRNIVEKRENLTKLRKFIHTMKYKENTIFDLPSQVRKLERALEKAWRRHAAGLPPNHIYSHPTNTGYSIRFSLA